MMKPIMTLRVAAVAMAASALFAAPAMADKGNRGSNAELAGGPYGYGQKANEHCKGDARRQYERHSRYGDDRRASRQDYHDRDMRYSHDRYGPSERRERIRAVRQCRSAIADKAWRVGFRDVDFDDDRRVHRVGPAGFNVRFDEVEFEGRRRVIERSVTCTIRRGQVVDIDWSDPYGSRYSQYGRKGHVWR